MLHLFSGCKLLLELGNLFYILNTQSDDSDLVHPVHQLALFVHNPGLSHIKAPDHVLRYLATGIAVFAFGALLLARSFVQDHVSASYCEAE